ncbi:uncharacterized protein LOC123644107 [Lemur catta]|uniref:uncharacterized protein LOC123644107 n=1 Tax=Lemur catta TaxID=9447 RepID=UPI001E26771C|nr:uncharacterized protein LOC123644107 [Lemur catta]
MGMKKIGNLRTQTTLKASEVLPNLGECSLKKAAKLGPARTAHSVHPHTTPRSPRCRLATPARLGEWTQHPGFTRRETHKSRPLPRSPPASGPRTPNFSGNRPHGPEAALCFRRRPCGARFLGRPPPKCRRDSAALSLPAAARTRPALGRAGAAVSAVFAQLLRLIFLETTDIAVKCPMAGCPDAYDPDPLSTRQEWTCREADGRCEDNQAQEKTL